ncbi:MAG: hypothetical protein ACOYXU_01970 [Nitrospirota bacterium]|jgi:hypothetical protein
MTLKHEIEFAVSYKLGSGKNGGVGQYFLHAGERSAVDVALEADRMLIHHTLPGGAFASTVDMNFMKFLRLIGSPQRSSQIASVGKPVVRFVKTPAGF